MSASCLTNCSNPRREKMKSFNIFDRNFVGEFQGVRELSQEEWRLLYMRGIEPLDGGLCQFDGKVRKLSKVLARLGKTEPEMEALRKELYEGKDSFASNGDLKVWISGKEEDIEGATTKFNSCLSPGECNDFTLPEHLNCNTLVAQVFNGDSWVGRCWLIWNGGNQWWLERRWYGNLSMGSQVRAGEMVISYLKEKGLYSEEKTVAKNFNGYLDSTDVKKRKEWSTCIPYQAGEIVGWKSQEYRALEYTFQEVRLEDTDSEACLLHRLANTWNSGCYKQHVMVVSARPDYLNWNGWILTVRATRVEFYPSTLAFQPQRKSFKLPAKFAEGWE